MKTAKYWEQRFTQLEAAQNRMGAAAAAEIQKAYDRAQRDISDKINLWYQRFADNNGITMAEAKQWLKGKDLKEFKWDVQEYIRHGEENAIDQSWAKELENASARWHISRYEALKIRMRESLEELTQKYQMSMDGAMSEVYRSGYYHTAFEVTKGIGVGYDIAAIDQSALEKVLSKPWAVDGVNFSERIWSNKQKLIDVAYRELTQGIMLGRDPQKTIDAIAKQMNASKSQVGRLVMTEEAYFASASRKDCFNDLGVEKYVIVATLDNRTSEICQEMDGKVFKMSDYQPGTTAPPFHVNCRSTVSPYFEDMQGIVERAARDENGKVYDVPGSMTYKEWKAEFVDNEPKNIIIKSAKDNGIKGIVDIEPKPINLDKYGFDDTHINTQREHDVTRAEAEQFVQEALVSVTRWNGRFINYYGENGAAYIDTEKKTIRTAFRKNEFDGRTKNFMEVVLRYGRQS